MLVTSKKAPTFFKIKKYVDDMKVCTNIKIKRNVLVFCFAKVPHPKFRRPNQLDFEVIRPASIPSASTRLCSILLRNY